MPIHSSANGITSGCHHLAAVNALAIYMGVKYLFESLLSFLGCTHLGVGLLYSMVTKLKNNFLRNLSCIH